MLFKVKGLVIKTVDLSESDRIMTLFTDEYGLLSVYANNSRSLKSRYMAAAQMFCYSSYVLYKKGDRFWVREVELIESFFGLRSDIRKLALASYLCELLSDVMTNEQDADSLRLALNVFYAIEHDLAPLDRIKAAFELRLVSQIGFMPDLDGCAECGMTEGEFYLDIIDGTIRCRECREYVAVEQRENGVIYTGEGVKRVILILTPGVHTAMRYVISCPLTRLLSFRLADEDGALFERATEAYLLGHIDRHFETLKFYKDIK